LILSHQHKFLFLKTMKTAGTSLELALSPLAGSDAIVTRVSPKDEQKRRVGDAPRNFIYDPKAFGKKRRTYFNHIRAATVRERLGEPYWNELFKFTIERNPWDRQVSFYHHWCERNLDSPIPFEEFMSLPDARLDNFGIYTIDGQIAVDSVLKFERLEQDLAELLGRLRLERISLGNAKSGTRPRGRHYSSYYSPANRKRVEDWYAREIVAFGYKFEQA
jgi:hypothetical protein